jgi:hypothetical protein
MRRAPSHHHETLENAMSALTAVVTLGAVLLASGAAATAGRPAAAAATLQNVTLTIPGVTTGCTAPGGQADSVGVRSLATGIAHPPAFPGEPTTKVSGGSIIITKSVDACSPKIFLKAFTGDDVVQAVITFFDPQGLPTTTFTLSNVVFITSVNTGTVNSESEQSAELLENVAMASCRLELRVGPAVSIVDFCEGAAL